MLMVKMVSLKDNVMAPLSLGNARHHTSPVNSESVEEIDHSGIGSKGSHQPCREHKNWETLASVW